MSDTFGGVAVEYFDIDYEIEKMKVDETNTIKFVDEDPKDIWVDDMDDDSDEAGRWVEQEEDKFISSFGD